MTSNDNSVNMQSAREAYHHGDLRAAAIAAGLAQLENRDPEAVSLREVARAVGVSATAIYRHFPDKAALFKALADEGLERLAAEQRAAGEAAGGGALGFNAMGRAYVRFALANPGLFRLIFAKAKGKSPIEWSDKPDNSMRLLQDNAARLVGGGEETEAAKAFALRAWSLVHGLAVLMLDGLVPADERLIDAVTDARLLMTD